MPKGKAPGADTKDAQHTAHLDRKLRDCEGINSGMMHRLALADKSFIPTPDGKVPGDKPNPLRAKRT